jgi:hypothetical protein
MAEVSTLKSETLSFGLEFGPNFFQAHLFSDAAGERHLKSIQIKEGAWAAYENELAGAGMPLFALLHTPNWTLVPSAIYDEDRAEDFLNFNTAYKAPEPIASDQLLPLDAVLIYPTDQVAEVFVTTHYPGLGLRHAAGMLLEIIQRMQQTHGQTATYIHQLGAAYHVTVYKNGVLELTNFIDAPHLEDIRYYTLFTLKQLNVALNSPVYLLGQAAANRELKQGLAQYCSKVEPIKYNANQMDSSAESENFIALNAHRCG